MDFKKKMRQRLIIAISYIAVGFALILADTVKGFENSFFVSFGIALVVMGILRLFRYRKITRDTQAMRKQELAESDERTRMISERAKSWAFSLSLLVSGILVIVLNLLGYREQAQPFAWYVCGMVTLYWVSFLFIQKKY